MSDEISPPPRRTWIGAGPPRDRRFGLASVLAIVLITVLGVIGLMVAAYAVFVVVAMNNYGNNK